MVLIRHSAENMKEAAQTKVRRKKGQN